MKNSLFGVLLSGLLFFTDIVKAQETTDKLSQQTYIIGEVVVTGTRNETDIRHLSQTVSVVDRQTIKQTQQPALLPILTEQVPGLFATARGVMGYSVIGRCCRRSFLA